MSKKYSSNDQRSIVKNPNNPAHGHDAANRAGQVHPPPPADSPATPTHSATTKPKQS